MSRRRAWLRAILPKTLYARALLLVLLPTLLVQAVTTTIFYTRHWDNVSRHMAIALANEVAYVARRAQNPDSREASLALAQQYFALQASFGAPLPPEPNADEGRFDRLQTELSTRLEEPFSIRSFGPDDDILMLIHLKDGTLRIMASGKRVASPTTYIFMIWINGAALVFLTIAVLFLRNQIKPIQQLAQAAEAFGRGQDGLEDYKPRGALEIRRAGQAFLLMRERIRRQVAKRTHMLAAISHDLRTPLTRMKLQIAMMKDDGGKEDLGRDIAEMEYMISEYLDFVRGEGTEPPTECSIQTLLGNLAADYKRQGKAFELDAPKDATLLLREQAIRRALSNLLNNAQRHGTRARVACQVTRANARITVEDDGPGIAEDDYGRALEAFQRLDEARTRDSAAHAVKPEGGVGLGLAIAKDVVLSHGGLIRLGRSSMGGLMVEITLPR